MNGAIVKDELPKHLPCPLDLLEICDAEAIERIARNASEMRECGFRI